MSNGQIPEVTIPCPRGCGKAKSKIGKNPGVLKFMYVPVNKGKITGITGLDGPPFSNQRFVDPDFLIDYAGTGPNSESWGYRPISEPECLSKPNLEEEEPQLTNEPQG